MMNNGRFAQNLAIFPVGFNQRGGRRNEREQAMVVIGKSCLPAFGKNV
jgi:hypothetical protein